MSDDDAPIRGRKIGQDRFRAACDSLRAARAALASIANDMHALPEYSCALAVCVGVIDAIRLATDKTYTASEWVAATEGSI